MPHKPNHEEFAQVGQGKPAQDVVEVYDAYYGKPMSNLAGLRSKQGAGKPAPGAPSPLKLGGK